MQAAFVNVIEVGDRHMNRIDWYKARKIASAARKAIIVGFAAFGAMALANTVGGLDLPGMDASADAQAMDGAQAMYGFRVASMDVQPQQRVVAAYLARRYRVAGDAIERLVDEAYTVGQKANLDPLLILAVVAIESRFNPIAESAYGAKGLMQIVPRFHPEKLVAHGGADALLEPSVNIRVGAQILKSYIRQAGSLESGLQVYAGAADDPDHRYAQKVMAEQARLHRAAGKTASPATI